MGRRGGEGGSALVFAVLALVGLELLAHGVLLLALQERLAATAGLRALQGRAAAEAATALAPDVALPDSLGALPILGRVAWGGRGAGPHVSRGTLVRLSREAWLLEGEGRAPGVAWASRAGRLVWVLDPVARAGERAEAVLLFGGAAVVAPGTVESPSFRSGGAPEGCRPWAASLDSLLPPAPATPLAWLDGTAGPALGRLGLERLVRALPPLSADAGTPEPLTEGGVCLPGAWNWGDPLDPDGPCGATYVSAAVAGSVVVEGGRGQGLLVASGDVTLKGAELHGLILAGGEVAVVGGGRMAGQIRAGGGVRVEAGARVVSSPCAVVRALHAAAPRLRVPVPLPPGRTFSLW